MKTALLRGLAANVVLVALLLIATGINAWGMLMPQ